MFKLCRKYFAGKERKYIGGDFFTRKAVKHYIKRQKEYLPAGHYWAEDKCGKLSYLGRVFSE